MDKHRQDIDASCCAPCYPASDPATGLAPCDHRNGEHYNDNGQRACVTCELILKIGCDCIDCMVAGERVH